MPSGADLEYARLLRSSGRSSGSGLDGAALAQLQDSFTSGKGTLSNLWGFLGDSITVGTSAAGVGGFASICSYLSGYKIKVACRAGYPGYRSDQVIQYIDSQVVPSGVKTCFVLVGTNDAGQDVPLSVFSQNVKIIIDKLKAYGITPILGTVPPRSAKRALISSYNAWLRVFASQQDIAIVGIHSALVDSSTGGYLAAYDSGDTIHPNLPGHIAMANAVINEVGGLVPPSIVPLCSDASDGVNLLTNPLFLTDANADGLGDTWGNTGTAAPAYSLITDTTRWKGKAQKVAIPAGGTYRRIEQTIATGFAPGDTLAWGCVFAVENIVGQVDVGVKFDRVDTGGAGATVVSLSTFNTLINKGTFWTTWVVPAGTTSFKIRHVADCTGGGSADFLFAQATVLNLTALGLA